MDIFYIYIYIYIYIHIYFDNFGVLGASRVNVDIDLAMAVQTLKNRGLDTHEEVVHSDTATALGIHMGLRNMLVSVAPMRLWHMTFVALLRRDVLSVPFALNKFVRASFNDSAKLWPSATAEVQAFDGLLPVFVSSWTRGWCSSIVATDASECGFGVCLKECKNVCETIGRTSERARFRKCHPDTPGARTAFFDQHRLGFDSG